MQAVRTFLTSREAIVLVALAILFLLIRLPGVDLPLHQDEYKWPRIVDPSMDNAEWGTEEIPHPPLGQFIYRSAGMILGYDVDFRYVPLIFGLANLFLFYYYLKRRIGTTVALIGASIFTVSYFSILASLMVDTDGQIMPFFFLLALIFYDAVQRAASPRQAALPLAGLLGAVIAGLFIKLSFILVPAALMLDFLWQKRHALNPKLLARYAACAIGFVVFMLMLLLLSPIIFPFFDLKQSTTYWLHFLQLDRNIFQTLVQVVKAILYASPFLIAAAFLLRRESIASVRPFLFYIGVGFLFYVVVFDFSIGALDRYLQFLVIPLSALGAVVLADVWPRLTERRTILFMAFGVIVAIAAFLLQFIPHSVPALHPKSEWIGRILSFEWNFVYPFSGGSGPLTFYVSFLFMGVVWIASGIAALVALLKKEYRPLAVAFMLPLSLVYTFVFAEEYLMGRINGSAPELVSAATAFIASNDDIETVVVYNDNGGDEIQRIGKYEKRLYTSPEFDIGKKIETINAFSGHYLVIDAPPIDPESVYQRYLAGCQTVYKEASRKMTATVYDCRNAPDIIH